MQFVEQTRIHEEVGLLRTAEFFRAEFQRLFEEGAALFVLLFAEGLFPYAAAHEGNVEGVHAGNDHGAGKAEAAVDEEGAVAVRAFGFLMHIGLFRGLREFGCRDEKAEAAGGVVAPASAAPDASFREILEMAQRVKDQTIADAKTKAEEIVAEAQARAEAELGSLQEEKDTLQQQVDELKTTGSQYRERFLQLIQEHKEILDRLAVDD